MGAHVIPSFSMMRAFTLREPYDFVVVARRDTFAAVRDVLHRHYPNTLLVFDTVRPTLTLTLTLSLTLTLTLILPLPVGCAAQSSTSLPAGDFRTVQGVCLCSC